jgi:hypothetical protein
MKRSLKDLYWNDKHRLYGVCISEINHISDSMELLLESSDDLCLYYYPELDDNFDISIGPEIYTFMTTEKFIKEYPDSIKLI